MLGARQKQVSTSSPLSPGTEQVLLMWAHLLETLHGISETLL